VHNLDDTLYKVLSKVMKSLDHPKMVNHLKFRIGVAQSSMFYYQRGGAIRQQIPRPIPCSSVYVEYFNEM
jgi:hypothetical protein